MIYVYVYPVDGFDRHIADNELMKAFMERKGVERYNLKEFMDAINDDAINTNTHWVKMMDDHEYDCPISYLHLDDLKELGFDTGNVSDDDLSEIAERLDETYRELSYWICLKVIAEDLGIPKIKPIKINTITA
jgi:hypothetical protein